MKFQLFVLLLFPLGIFAELSVPNIFSDHMVLQQGQPHSGLVVTIEIGEANDIHPRNKQEVGRRLSRWALTDVYNRLELRGGPVPAGAEVNGEKVVVRFDQTGSGLVVVDGFELGGFTLAGEDGVFYPAEANIDGKTRVVVFSADVPRPVHLRYAWQNNPVDANLGNHMRLPATPFELEIE